MSPDFLDLMNKALADLYGGWHFYIRSALMVETPNRIVLRPFFKSYALENANHIVELGDLIMYLGGSPTPTINAWRNDLRDPKHILTYAAERESAMVKRYDVIAPEIPSLIHPFMKITTGRTVHLKHSAAGI